MNAWMRCLGKLAYILLTPLGHADCSTLPERPIHIIVPNTTGSAYDLYVRGMEAQLEFELQREVVVVNVAGGGGIVGARKIAAASADGTTLGILNGAGLLTAHLIYGPSNTKVHCRLSTTCTKHQLPSYSLLEMWPVPALSV